MELNAGVFAPISRLVEVSVGLFMVIQYTNAQH